jgi:hypothetical protein
VDATRPLGIPAGPHHRAAAALGTHPPGSAPAEAGPGSAGVERNHPGPREGGGWPRLNRLFGGELEQVLHRFHEAVWEAA